MTGGVAFGLIATAVALAAFLGWTYHELKRVDRFAPSDEQPDDES